MACVSTGPGTAPGGFIGGPLARGTLMVKEFEQQNEQDLAIPVHPWLPRARATPQQKEAVEEVLSFAATHPSRRAGTKAAGWFSAGPGRPPEYVKVLGLGQALA